jgi:hypothetical protein
MTESGLKETLMALCDPSSVSNLVIFLPLLNEGTDVWRPVEAEPLGGGLYRVLGDAPEDETWAHAPGSTVRCELKVFSDGTEALAATGR